MVFLLKNRGSLSLRRVYVSKIIQKLISLESVSFLLSHIAAYGNLKDVLRSGKSE